MISISRMVDLAVYFIYLLRVFPHGFLWNVFRNRCKYQIGWLGTYWLFLRRFEKVSPCLVCFTLLSLIPLSWDLESRPTTPCQRQISMSFKLLLNDQGSQVVSTWQQKTPNKQVPEDKLFLKLLTTKRNFNSLLKC